MISLPIYFLLIRSLSALTNRDKDIGGSSLFFNRYPQTTCWSKNELTQLHALKIFQQLALPALPPEKVDSQYLRDTIKYIQNAMSEVKKIKDQETRKTLMDAMADTFGGNLKSSVLPTCRIAFYAGYVPFGPVRQLHEISDEMKQILNTRGLGWKEPARLPGWSNLSVAKLTVGTGKFKNPCTFLTIKRDKNNCISLPAPQLDDKHEPNAIALPFKSVRVFSMISPASENILVKYYTTASRCILQRSPPMCRHSDLVNFNNDMWHWMKVDVASHLLDEKLYSAFGGVLRIAAAAQLYGRGLARRSLIEDEVERSNNTKLLSYLLDSHVCIDMNWTPWIYICCTLLAALLIIVLQIVYDKMFSSKKQSGSEDCKECDDFCADIRYADVETNFPAMLPKYAKTETLLYEKESSSHTPHHNSLQTQRLNSKGNNQQVMAVSSSSKRRSSPSDKTSSSERTSKASYDSGKHTGRSSPPKIETPMYQLKIKKSHGKLKPNSSKTKVPTASGTSWSRSSSTSRGSRGSPSSKSSGRSRSSRDVEWAKRVVSRHSHRRSSYGKGVSGVDVDVNSYTTPPSGM